jgi:hypothetical protein
MGPDHARLDAVKAELLPELLRLRRVEETAQEKARRPERNKPDCSIYRAARGIPAHRRSFAD